MMSDEWYFRRFHPLARPGDDGPKRPIGDDVPRVRSILGDDEDEDEDEDEKEKLINTPRD